MTDKELLDRYKKALERIYQFSINDAVFSTDDYSNLLMMQAIAEEALYSPVLVYSDDTDKD